ncbi:acyltransferase family protein [Luteibacter aegosomaticola]|uniref:acyltransferase family protein n=1 Tax=Luteibacter aegosomaticola TaxID=2911538 RepID=UPI001FF87E95|nr:acyltransferase family protein [Luteibacter aegosomaticola]UPG89999.1 acyltransferase family protein [Luteibacter aegosomaticola]
MPAIDEAHERYDFLDWLRVIAIFVLFFFHTGMIFVGWGWHVTNNETIPALAWPMDIAHRLRMPLLFVIAGAGMAFALRRRSAGQFARERTVKLLIPLVIGMFLIVPPQIYFERLLAGQWHGGYLAFYATRVLQFRPYPAGDFSWHHLWFIAYLYIYVLLLLPLMLWWKRVTWRPTPGPWLFLLGIPLGINEACLKSVFPEAHTLVNDWYIFNHYLLLTTYGYLLASMPGAWKWFADVRRWSLGAGSAVLGFLIWALIAGVVPHDSVADHVGANVFTWLWMMVFLGYGYRYLSFANPLLAWARDASYPVYILHQTVIVAMGYVVIQEPWSPWTKYVTVLLSSMAICVFLYAAIVRRWSFLRFAFGMKVSAQRQPSSTALPSGSAVDDIH